MTFIARPLDWINLTLKAKKLIYILDGIWGSHTTNTYTYKYTYQLTTPIQIMKQKNRFPPLDTHMSHIFMKYVFLSFFKQTLMFNVAQACRYQIWGEPGDRGTHKQVDWAKKEAKFKNGSQITKFFMSKIMCNLLKHKGRREGSLSTAKPLRRSH